MQVDDEVKSAAREIYDIEKAMDTAIAKASEPRIKHLAVEIREGLKE